LFYSRTKSVTQNIRGFIERQLRAAQQLLGSRMRVSKQWFENHWSKMFFEWLLSAFALEFDDVRQQESTFCINYLPMLS